MYWTSSSIVRRPVDATFAREMTAALRDTTKENNLAIIQKSIGRCNLSILSAQQVIFAVQKTDGSFDATVAASELLEATNFTPLNPVSAVVTGLKLKRIRAGELRFMAFMSADSIENETKTAHSLLSEQSLTEYPYLPGVHISFGTLLGDFCGRKRSRFLDELSDRYIGTEVKLQPAMLREFQMSHQTTYTSLADIATNSIATQLEMRRQNGPLFN